MRRVSTLWLIKHLNLSELNGRLNKKMKLVIFVRQYFTLHTKRSQYSRLVTNTQKINQIKKILLFLLVFSTSVSVRIKLLTRLHNIDIYYDSTIKISSTNVSFNFVSFLFCPPGEVLWNTCHSSRFSEPEQSRNLDTTIQFYFWTFSHCFELFIQLFYSKLLHHKIFSSIIYNMIDCVSAW